LHQAFMRTMREPDFIRDAARIGIDVRPKSGPEVADIVRSVYQTAPDIIEEVRSALNP
jgi:hypothetical protein